MAGGPNKNMAWGRLGVLAAWLVCVAGASAVAGQLATIDADAHYPEGPLWRAGRLFYVEYSASNIKTWDGRHTALYWHKDGCGPSALIAFGDRVLVACYDDNSLVELDASGNEVRTVRNDSGGKPSVGPNAFASDGHGGVYFSASGVYDIKAPITGGVLHLSADGRDTREVAGTIHYSNGLTVSKDGRHLLVAEMLAVRILSFPIQADGTLGPRVVWARLQDLAPATPHEDAYNGPNGFELGSDGNYYIAQNGSGRVPV